MSSDDDHQLIVQIIYVQYMGIKSTERDYIPLSINSSEIQIIITTQAKKLVIIFLEVLWF